jgi:hypothetical protein
VPNVVGPALAKTGDTLATASVNVPANNSVFIEVPFSERYIGAVKDYAD